MQYPPEDELDAVIDMLTDDDKNKLFKITSECFEIIGPEEEE